MTYIQASSKLDLFGAMELAAQGDSAALAALSYLQNVGRDVELITCPQDSPMLTRKQFAALKEGAEVPLRNPVEDHDWTNEVSMELSFAKRTATYEQYAGERFKRNDGNEKTWHDFPPNMQPSEIALICVSPNWAVDFSLEERIVSFCSLPDDLSGDLVRTIYYLNEEVTKFMLGLEMLGTAMMARRMPSGKADNEADIYIAGRRLTANLLDKAMDGYFFKVIRAIDRRSEKLGNTSEERNERGCRKLLKKMDQVFGISESEAENWMRQYYISWEIQTHYMDHRDIRTLLIQDTY